MSERVKLSARARAAVQSDARLSVLVLLEGSDWTARELATELGRTKQAVLLILTKLIEADLVRVVSTETVAGGEQRTYGGAYTGWAVAIRQLNELVADEPMAGG